MLELKDKRLKKLFSLGVLYFGREESVIRVHHGWTILRQGVLDGVYYYWNTEGSWEYINKIDEELILKYAMYWMKKP